MIEKIFPAEFDKHQGTIAMFPFRTDIWRDDAFHMQRYMLSLIEIISKYEQVYLFCHPSIDKQKIPDIPNVTIITAPYNDIWARDISPTFLIGDNGVECLDWKFNAWGGKEGSYSPWDEDDSFASFISKRFNFSSKRINLVLEGGAIISDGNGTVFTTRSVLLNRNRNPFRSFQEVDALLKNVLGANKIVWLKNGLVNDETNGHVDNILSVIKPGEILLAWTDDKNNPNYRRVRQIYDQIINQYECTIYKVPLPMPQFMNEEEEKGLTVNPNALLRKAGDLLPASYLNFYFVNGGVILPIFNCPQDDEVVDIFRNVFGDREIIPLYSREPLLGGGGIHCILHEIPKVL